MPRRKRKGPTKVQIERYHNHLADINKMTLFGTKTSMSKSTTIRKSISTEQVLRETRNNGCEYKSAPLTPPPMEEYVRYEGEMAEREKAAQEEIERKKKRVGIAFNKGAYQYISDETDPKTLGR